MLADWSTHWSATVYCNFTKINVILIQCHIYQNCVILLIRSKWTKIQNRQTNMPADCTPTHWSSFLQCNCTKIDVRLMKILWYLPTYAWVYLFPPKLIKIRYFNKYIWDENQNPLAVSYLSDFFPQFWINMPADCRFTHWSASLQ